MAIGSFSVDNDSGAYRSSYIRCRYSWKSGKMVLPVAGPPGTPAEVVRVSAPCGRKVVIFDIERDTLHPEGPDIEDDTALQVFLSGWVETSKPELQADGETYRWRVRGRYVYALRLPVTTDEGFPCPSGPETNTQPALNFHGPQFFVQDIVTTPTMPQVTLDATKPG